jgi:hypothetical protein
VRLGHLAAILCAQIRALSFHASSVEATNVTAADWEKEKAFAAVERAVHRAADNIGKTIIAELAKMQTVADRQSYVVSRDFAIEISILLHEHPRAAGLV